MDIRNICIWNGDSPHKTSYKSCKRSQLAATADDTKSNMQLRCSKTKLWGHFP